MSVLETYLKDRKKIYTHGALEILWIALKGSGLHIKERRAFLATMTQEQLDTFIFSFFSLLDAKKIDKNDPDEVSSFFTINDWLVKASNTRVYREVSAECRRYRNKVV